MANKLISKSVGSNFASAEILNDINDIIKFIIKYFYNTVCYSMQ